MIPMKEQELTKETLGEDTKLVHFLLQRRGITEIWWKDYDDLVQDILCGILLGIHQFKPDRGTKSHFFNMKITQVLGAYVSESEAIKRKMQHGSIDDMLVNIPSVEDNFDTALYAEEVFEGLTDVQRMEAFGYTFKEIQKELGGSEAVMRNHKGLASWRRR